MTLHIQMCIRDSYIAECKKDMAGMNVKPATKHPLATEEICGMVEMISELIEKGYAYEMCIRDRFIPIRHPTERDVLLQVKNGLTSSLQTDRLQHSTVTVSYTHLSR